MLLNAQSVNRVQIRHEPVPVPYQRPNGFQEAQHQSLLLNAVGYPRGVGVAAGAATTVGRVI